MCVGNSDDENRSSDWWQLPHHKCLTSQASIPATDPLQKDSFRSSRGNIRRSTPALPASRQPSSQRRGRRQQPVRRSVRVKTVQRVPRPLDDAQVYALLEHLRCLRDRALILLMLQAGLRPSEALGLHLEDGHRRALHPTVARQPGRRRHARVRPGQRPVRVASRARGGVGCAGRRLPGLNGRHEGRTAHHRGVQDRPGIAMARARSRPVHRHPNAFFRPGYERNLIPELDPGPGRRRGQAAGWRKCCRRRLWPRCLDADPGVGLSTLALRRLRQSRAVHHPRSAGSRSSRANGAAEFRGSGR